MSSRTQSETAKKEVEFLGLSMADDVSAIIREYCGDNVRGVEQASEAILSYFLNCGKEFEDV